MTFDQMKNTAEDFSDCLFTQFPSLTCCPGSSTPFAVWAKSVIRTFALWCEGKSVYGDLLTMESEVPTGAAFEVLADKFTKHYEPDRLDLRICGGWSWDKAVLDVLNAWQKWR